MTNADTKKVSAKIIMILLISVVLLLLLLAGLLTPLGLTAVPLVIIWYLVLSMLSLYVPSLR